MSRYRLLDGKIIVSVFFFIAILASLFWFVAFNQVITVDNAQVKARLTTIRSSANGLVELVAIEKIKSFVDIDESIVNLNVELIDEQINATRHRFATLESAIDHLKAEKTFYLNSIEANQNNMRLQRDIIQSKIALNRYELEKSNELLVDMRDQFKQEMLTKKNIVDQEIRNRQYKVEQEINTFTLKKVDNQLQGIQNERDKAVLFDKKIEGLTTEKAVLLSELKVLTYKAQQYRYNPPFAGILNEVFVNAGEYVLEGQRLYNLHSAKTQYVEAKFYESDFSYLAVGKPVVVILDAYTDKPIQGVITKVGSVTDSQLNVLPSSKITSNFIRIRQFIPVRIELEETDLAIIPGLMATVKLDKHK